MTTLLISNNRTHSTTFPALSWPHHLRLVTEELGPRSSHVYVRLFTLYSSHFSSTRRLRRRRRRPCFVHSYRVQAATSHQHGDWTVSLCFSDATHV